MEIDYVDRETGNAWLNEAQEISLMIGGFMKTKRRFLSE